MSVSMKLKNLQWELENLESFETPKEWLEQYSTPPHLAASMLHTAQSRYNDIDGRMILDAGCGPGILTIAASFLGAQHILSVDIDQDALFILQNNLQENQIDNVDIIQCNFLSPGLLRMTDVIETVIMNPPFGTKCSAGVDIKFLKQGLKLATRALYTMHKTSTRSHIVNVCSAERVKGHVIAELKYELPRTLKHHRKDVQVINVDLWRIEPGKH